MVRLTSLAVLFTTIVGCTIAHEHSVDVGDPVGFCDELRIATECDGIQADLLDCESIVESLPAECPVWAEDLLYCADLSNTCYLDDLGADDFCSSLLVPECGELPRLVIEVGGPGVLLQAPLTTLPPGMVTMICEELSFETSGAETCSEPSLFPEGMTTRFCEAFVETMSPECPATVSDLQSCMTYMSNNPCANADDYDPCGRLSENACSNRVY